MSKKRLGKGLGALLPNDDATVAPQDSQSRVIEINIDQIEANPYQPRKQFDSELLKELSESIKKHGLIQPISVRKIEKGFQLITGERRLRASKIAGLSTISAIEMDLNDKQMMEYALIENIQRDDLNPIEEAIAYKKLMKLFGLTQEEVSNCVSKSRSSIANTIRLLNLPNEIQDSVSRETISMGHARALLGLIDKDEMLKVWQKCINEELTVRQLEGYIKILKLDKQSKNKIKETEEEPNEEVLVIEKKLKERLGSKVTISTNRKNSSITIECFDKNRLKKLIQILEKI
ncbi:MAG: ParB/RepB/Spo0J family partition protein [Halanaerobiales bacterium]|nr:ParB/RepB/Spo0J family partition protein [Halanaerobiales bacterium]